MSALDLAEIIETNRARCARWHDPDTDAWTAADWSNALAGEVGELQEAVESLVLSHHLGSVAGLLANTVKKVRRHESGTATEIDPPLDDLRQAAADEVADVLLYLLLLADHLGVDVPVAVAEKFNRVSERQGFPERLEARS